MQSRGLADALLDNLRRELTKHHTILEFCRHETRLDHLSTIGNGIVEGEGTDGR